MRAGFLGCIPVLTLDHDVLIVPRAVLSSILKAGSRININDAGSFHSSRVLFHRRQTSNVSLEFKAEDRRGQSKNEISRHVASTRQKIEVEHLQSSGPVSTEYLHERGGLMHSSASASRTSSRSPMHKIQPSNLHMSHRTRNIMKADMTLSKSSAFVSALSTKNPTSQGKIYVQSDEEPQALSKNTRGRICRCRAKMLEGFGILGLSGNHGHIGLRKLCLGA